MSRGKRILLLVLLFSNILGWGSLAFQWYITTTNLVLEKPETKAEKSKELLGFDLVLSPIEFDSTSRKFIFDTKIVAPYLTNIDLGEFEEIQYRYTGREYNAQLSRFRPACVGDLSNWGCSGGRGERKHPNFTFESVGWYPFEEYFGTITADIEYDDRLVALPFLFEPEENSDAALSQLQISTKVSDNFISIIFLRPFRIRFLYVMTILLIIVFTVAVFNITDLSDLLQVSMAILIGIWGLKELLSPNDLPIKLRYGSEQIILYLYFFLGITILLWFFDRWATSRGWSLFQLPNNQGANLVNIGGDIRDSTVIVPQSGTKVEIISGFGDTYKSGNSYWNSKEAAKYLNISTRKLANLAKDGHIFGVKDSGHWKFIKEDLDKWREGFNV